MLKYITISDFKKTSHCHRIYYSCYFCKYFRKNINTIVLVSHIYNDEYQHILKIEKVDYYPKNKYSFTQH